MSSGSIIAVAAPQWPFAAVNLPFRLARTNARWQLVHGDPTPWRPKTIAQHCGVAIAVSASSGSAFLSLLKILSFWKRPG